MNKTFNAENIHFNACVGLNGNYQIDTYALGYYETVCNLVKLTLEMETTIDAIVYPIVYSARHYIELMLKHQIGKLIKINKIVNEKFNSQVLNIHEISKLWNEFKKVSSLDKRYNNLIDKAEEYINDFSEIDDNGEKFRYPYSIEKKKYLVELYCIDILNFGDRFNEIHEILKEIGNLTDYLYEEYKQRSFIGNVSRADIEKIAHKLPSINKWNKNDFKEIKNQIKTEYNLSSNQLSKIINFIKTHYEFSSIIDNEIKIKELNLEQLKSFIRIYDEYRANINKYPYNQYLLETTDKICKKFSKIQLASLAQLYEIGFFGLFSEEYQKGVEIKMKELKSELIRVQLLATRFVKKFIYRGLKELGQETLLKVFEGKDPENINQY